MRSGVGRGAFGRLLIFSKLGNDPLFLYQAPRLEKHSMLNSAEHEVLNAHKYKNIKKFGFFQARINLECYFSAILDVGILTF